MAITKDPKIDPEIAELLARGIEREAQAWEERYGWMVKQDEGRVTLDEAIADLEHRAGDSSVDDLEWQALGHEMSELSEERHSAGWLSGLEYEVWRDLVEPYRALYAAEVARLLLIARLARRLDVWVVWDEDAGGERPVPLERWRAMYEERRKGWA